MVGEIGLKRPVLVYHRAPIQDPCKSPDWTELVCLIRDGWKNCKEQFSSWMCEDDATDLSLADMEVFIAAVDNVALWSACPNET